jgi:DNA-binding IclR family transcriptional regulator
MAREPVKYERKAGVAAVERALAILEAFNDQEPALTLAQLAERTQLYKSTLLRLCTSLVQAGFLKRREDGRYMIGVASLRLAGQYQRALQPAELIMPVLRELVNETGESASFNVREGNLRVCLHRIDSPQVVREHVRVGDCLDLPRGSGGKVLLAFSGEPGKAYDEIRKSGLCVTRGERHADATAVACPVFSASGLAGSLTVSGPTARFDAKAVRRIEKLLLEAAARLSRLLGGDTLPFAVKKIRSK